MRQKFLTIACLVAVIFSFRQLSILVFAEQSGSSPESGADSRIKEAFDFLVTKGANYGATNAADWTNDWGSYWNRVMEAAVWEPDGTASAGDVPSGFTFYAGNADRTIKTGTLFQNQALIAYDDARASDYTGEEGTWTLTASGGTAVSVTDNSVTITLSSNQVYQDNWSKLYWTDGSDGGNIVDNEFSWVEGNDRSNPAGNSCNFNSTGTANAFCDNQDPLSAYTEDDDVSAAEFCLNLQLDADNSDADTDGTTGVETDWRLPTQKELMQAYINGASNNIPNPNTNFWSSTEINTTQSNAWIVNLSTGTTGSSSKASGRTVRCVRRG